MTAGVSGAGSTGTQLGGNPRLTLGALLDDAVNLSQDSDVFLQRRSQGRDVAFMVKVEKSKLNCI